MLESEIFQPSLRQDVNYETKSFAMSGYLLISLIGGIVPAIVLGIINAVWLRVGRRKIGLLAGLGVIIVVTQLVLQSTVALNDNSISLVRLGGVVFAGACYYLTRNRYRNHLAYGGRKVSILALGIPLLIVGAIFYGPAIMDAGRMIHDGFVR